MMETTFYDDPLQFPTKEEFKMLKRPVTLDLDSQRPSKKPRYNCLLTSPDLNMLKLASPDLERLIIAQNGLVTTTPTPTQYVFPKNVTEEQEQYARGFVDALNQLHQSSYPGMGQQPHLHDLDENSMDPATVAVTSATNSCSVMQCPPPPSTSMAVSSHQPPSNMPSVNHMHHIAPPVTSTGVSGLSSTANSVGMQGGLAIMPAVTTSSAPCYQQQQQHQEAANNYLQVVVKEEPQTVPSLGISMTPPLSPIDMEDQERIKLERKRLRNRIAASKCRRRKLERIARLEEKVRQLKGENADLGNTCSKLREQVCQLKQQVMDHVRNGCQIMTTHNF